MEHVQHTTRIITLLPIPRDGAILALLCLAALFGLAALVVWLDHRRARLEQAEDDRRFLATLRSMQHRGEV